MDKTNRSIDKKSIKKIFISPARIQSQGISEAVWAAKFIYSELEKGGKEYLKPSFLYSLSSAIEGCINEVIIDFCFYRFGKDYKRFSNSFLKMNLHDKLNILIPLISNYKLDLNHKKLEVIHIKKIIELRNQLVHIKAHYFESLNVLLKNGEHYFSELNEEELEIYHNSKYEKIDLTTLKRLYDSQKAFTKIFHDLDKNIRRRYFRKEDWFTILDKNVAKIEINNLEFFRSNYQNKFK